MKFFSLVKFLGTSWLLFTSPSTANEVNAAIKRSVSKKETEKTDDTTDGHAVNLSTGLGAVTSSINEWSRYGLSTPHGFFAFSHTENAPLMLAQKITADLIQDQKSLKWWAETTHKVLIQFEKDSGISLHTLSKEEQDIIVELMKRKINKRMEEDGSGMLTEEILQSAISSIRPNYTIDKNRIFVGGAMLVVHSDGRFERFSKVDFEIPDRLLSRPLLLHLEELHPDNQDPLEKKLNQYFAQQLEEDTKKEFNESFQEYLRIYFLDAIYYSLLKKIFKTGQYKQLPSMTHAKTVDSFIQSMKAFGSPRKALLMLKHEYPSELRTEIETVTSSSEVALSSELKTEILQYMQKKLTNTFGDKQDFQDLWEKVIEQGVDPYSDAFTDDLYQLLIIRVQKSKESVPTLINDMRKICNNKFTPEPSVVELKNKTLEKLKKIQESPHRKEIIESVFADEDKKIIVCSELCSKYTGQNVDFFGFYSPHVKHVYLATISEEEHPLEQYPDMVGGELDAQSNQIKTVIDEFMHAGADSAYKNLSELYEKGDTIKKQQFEAAIQKDTNLLENKITIAKKKLNRQPLNTSEQETWNKLYNIIKRHVKKSNLKATVVETFVETIVPVPPKGFSVMGKIIMVQYPLDSQQHPLLSERPKEIKVEIISLSPEPLQHLPGYCIARAKVLDHQQIFDVTYTTISAIEQIYKVFHPYGYNKHDVAKEILNKIPYEQWGDELIHELMPNVSKYYENDFLGDLRIWKQEQHLEKLTQQLEDMREAETVNTRELETNCMSLEYKPQICRN